MLPVVFMSVIRVPVCPVSTGSAAGWGPKARSLSVGGREFVQGIFGERLHNNALLLSKGGLHIPRLSAHSAFQSCHLKNECIIVLNLEIWF